MPERATWSTPDDITAAFHTAGAVVDGGTVRDHAFTITSGEITLVVQGSADAIVGWFHQAHSAALRATGAETPGVRDLAVPEQINPNEPVVRFVQFECRVCGGKSPAARDPLQDNASTEADDWHGNHFDTTGHDRFYRWQLERGTGRVYRL